MQGMVDASERASRDLAVDLGSAVTREFLHPTEELPVVIALIIGRARQLGMNIDYHWHDPKDVGA